MSFFEVLDELQTSFIMIAALIPGGHNKQLRGHLQGAVILHAQILTERCSEQWCDKRRSKSGSGDCGSYLPGTRNPVEDTDHRLGLNFQKGWITERGKYR